MIDLHSHILPGLDDGARDMDHALAMARVAVKDGISKIVGTPHILRGSYGRYDLRRIQDVRDKLAVCLESAGVSLEVFSGAEVRVSHSIIDELKKKRDYLVINGSTYMFLEFPSDHLFSGVKQLFFDIMSEGIQIIIAHPERNSVFRRQPTLLYELVEMGCHCQANAGCINGIYGREIQESVLHFLDWNYIHFIASDGHNTDSPAPRLSEAVKKASERIGQERAQKLVTVNPEDVLNNRELSFRPEPSSLDKKKKSMKVRIPRLRKRH